MQRNFGQSLMPSVKEVICQCSYLSAILMVLWRNIPCTLRSSPRSTWLTWTSSRRWWKGDDANITKSILFIFDLIFRERFGWEVSEGMSVWRGEDSREFEKLREVDRRIDKRWVNIMIISSMSWSSRAQHGRHVWNGFVCKWHEGRKVFRINLTLGLDVLLMIELQPGFW